MSTPGAPTSRPLEIAAWSLLIVILALMIVVLVLGFVARKPCAVPPVLVAALTETRRRASKRRAELRRLAQATRKRAQSLAATDSSLSSAAAAIEYKNKPANEVIVPVLDDAQAARADAAIQALNYVPAKRHKLNRIYKAPSGKETVTVKLPARDFNLDAHMKGLKTVPLSKTAQEALDALTNMTGETYFSHGSMFIKNKARSAAPYALQLPGR